MKQFGAVESIMKIENNKFTWLKQHADTIILLSTIFTGLLWMNGKFNDLEKDMAVIKTVLLSNLSGK